jgi:hypothetical protein
MSSPYHFLLLLLQYRLLFRREPVEHLHLCSRGWIAANRDDIVSRGNATSGSGRLTQVNTLLHAVPFQYHIVAMRLEQTHTRHYFTTHAHADLSSFGLHDCEAILAAREDSDGPDSVK